jgi:phosphoserine phosphatase RsbU/P
MHSLFRSRTNVDPPPVAEPVPNAFPKIEGAEIAADFIGQRTGGDFYDSLRVTPERVLFGMLDVSGRRDENRGILAAAQETFRKVGAELFSRPDINESEAMTELSHSLNRSVIESSSGVHSCPAFIGCYHEKFGTLCYTNAGHTPGLLHDSTGISELPSTGLPLGLFSHATSDAPIVGVEKGAVVLLVSRGVIECGSDHDKSDEEFGRDRLKQLLQTAPPGGAQAVCAFILDAVGTFSARIPVCDDRTALALLRTG